MAAASAWVRGRRRAQFPFEEGLQPSVVGQGPLRVAHLGVQAHDPRVGRLIEGIGQQDAFVGGNCVMKFSPLLMQPGEPVQ